MEDVPYARMLREGWLLIVLGALIGAGIALGVTQVLPQSYSASSTLLLQVNSSSASLFERNQFSLARVQSYPGLIHGPEVVNGVRENLALDAAEYSDGDIRRMLSAENPADTVLLVVHAEATTATMAADAANAAASHLSQAVDEIENPSAQDEDYVSLEPAIPAIKPLAPSSPRVTAITGLGLIAGFALGAILAVYRTTTQQRVRTFADVRRASGLPVVGHVPLRPRTSKKFSQEMALNETAANITSLGGAALSMLILVPASEHALDTATITGLSRAYTRLGHRVCVIDTQTPAQLSAGALSTLLAASPSPADACDFAVVRAGAGVRSEDVVIDALEGLQDRYHTLIFLCSDQEAAVLQRLVGRGAGVVIGAHHKTTTADDLHATSTRLSVMNIHPIGVLFTQAKQTPRGVVAESWPSSTRDHASA